MDYLDLPEDLGQLEYLRDHPAILLAIAVNVRKYQKIDSFKDCIIKAAKSGLGGAFTWSTTPEGGAIWADINIENVESFYKKYPEQSQFRKDGLYPSLYSQKEINPEDFGFIEKEKCFMTFRSYERMDKSKSLKYLEGKFIGLPTPKNWQSTGRMDYLFNSTFEITASQLESLKQNRDIMFKSWGISTYMLSSFGKAKSLEEYLKKSGIPVPSEPIYSSSSPSSKRYVINFKSYMDMIDVMGVRNTYMSGKYKGMGRPDSWNRNGKMDYLYGETLEISEEQYLKLGKGLNIYINGNVPGQTWFIGPKMLNYFGEDLEKEDSYITSGLQTGDEEETPFKALPMKEIKTNLFN